MSAMFRTVSRRMCFCQTVLKVMFLFSQKWSGELGKYANDKTQWQGKDSVLNKVKTENELGYGSVWHNEDESADIYTLCNVMEESGFKYGVAYVNFDKRIRRYVFTYKKGKLRNSFMDFFDSSHEFYVAYNKKEAEKQKNREEKVAKVTKTVLEPVMKGVVTSIVAGQENQNKSSNSTSQQVAVQKSPTNSINTSTNNTNQTQSVNHEKNRAYLKSHFQNMARNIISRSEGLSGSEATLVRSKCGDTISSAELNRYEYLLEHNYSTNDAADKVFDEFRRASLPKKAQ